MILYLKVHPADIQDRDGAKLLLEGLREELPRLATIYADGAYSGELIAWVAETLGCELKIIRRPKGARGFVLLAKRWVVERTFGWLNLYRRLSKNYEQLACAAESWVRWAMINIMIRRLAPSS